MKVSIASYAFHGLLEQKMMDVFGYLETCKYRYHVNAADIWNGFFPTLDDDFIKKVKLGLDERDMVLANLCVDGPHIWDDDPAVREKNYQNALTYLQVAKKLGARVIEADSEDSSNGNVAANAIDGDPGTIWHTQWQPAHDPMPHHLIVDLGRAVRLEGITYLPRQDGANGRIAGCELYCATDLNSWGTPVAKPAWHNNPIHLLQLIPTVPFFQFGRMDPGKV